jgi:hypothetical protein
LLQALLNVVPCFVWPAVQLCCRLCRTRHVLSKKAVVWNFLISFLMFFERYSGGLSSGWALWAYLYSNLDTQCLIIILTDEFRHFTLNQERVITAFSQIFTYLLFMNRPPLWSGGQSSWLQIQRSGFGSRRYQIFWEVVGLEHGPLSLLSTKEK